MSNALGKFKSKQKKLLKQIPGLREIVAARDALKLQLKEVNKFVPPGHFYSPIPDLTFVYLHIHQQIP